MGLSGSGKSTLIRHINRLIDPTEGEIHIDGTNIMNCTPDQLIDWRRNRISMVFQRFGLFPHKTVMQNVGYGLEMQGKSEEDRDKIAMEKIDDVGLNGFENQFPNQLSGGMQQRASIARALAFDADILLMDEPFGALDEIVRDHLNEQLLKLWNTTKKTICFVTHSIPEAVFLSSKIVVMSPRPGRISKVIKSNLPNDRTLDIRESKEFLDIAAQVREVLRKGTADE